MSTAALAVLIALIALADDRVRERVRSVDPQAVEHRVLEGTTRVGAATITARDVVREKGALTVVVLAGAVLFVCMLRT
jgi:NaMN:DMB phosphoribosyltransferase